MNQRPLSNEQLPAQTIRPASIADTIEYVKQVGELQSVGIDKSKARTVCGRVLAVHNDSEKPATGVRVELFVVSPLKEVLSALSDEVLDHCRTLLLERVKPIDLYSRGEHVFDAPRISFADIALLHKTPGYELLVAAAKSQPDTSFRQLLGNNPAIVQPLLCYYHPNSLPAVCAANTTTDTAGFFKFSVLEQSDQDKQRGYFFVVRRSISRSLYITLYNPMPTAWYTHWDWSENENITLRTKHPLALSAQSPI